MLMAHNSLKKEKSWINSIRFCTSTAATAHFYVTTWGNESPTGGVAATAVAVLSNAWPTERPPPITPIVLSRCAVFRFVFNLCKVNNNVFFVAATCPPAERRRRVAAEPRLVTSRRRVSGPPWWGESDLFFVESSTSLIALRCD